MAFTTMMPLLIKGVIAIIAIAAARLLHRGYVHRTRVRSLQAQGLPILPHSLLLGHLPIFADFRKNLPPDVNIYMFHTWLIENCNDYFPGLDYHPPVVYLDLWPISESLALVNDPVAASQFTMGQNLPKTSGVREWIRPLTSCIDLLCTEGQIWKAWRSRFSPGFSQRNLTAILPEVIEEANVFVEGLNEMAGKDGAWGSVFQLEKRTTNLTFDIICRAALDVRLHEQTRASDSSLKSALLDQLRLMGIVSNPAKALWHRASVARNNRTMREFLLPQIQRKLESTSENTQKKTIVDLAIKHVGTDEPNASKKQPSAEFVDRLVANLKIFLFAGHDTTASTICFMTKLLQDNPSCLEKVRAEHDAVLGPEVNKAAEILTASPHLLQSLPYTLAVIKETLRIYPLAATVRESPPRFYLTGTNSSVRYPMDGFGLWLSPPGV
ncbi:hypothetical protein FJTKL_12243 [Diaporthe vaccinii]|uniref:Cytochrome P450 n=1 Tax=Diaporthe vaccinii TaxID=105482 RepID=A0ABR4EER2_9PEZI